MGWSTETSCAYPGSWIWESKEWAIEKNQYSIEVLLEQWEQHGKEICQARLGQDKKGASGGKRSYHEISCGNPERRTHTLVEHKIELTDTILFT